MIDEYNETKAVPTVLPLRYILSLQTSVQSFQVICGWQHLFNRYAHLLGSCFTTVLRPAFPEFNRQPNIPKILQKFDRALCGLGGVTICGRDQKARISLAFNKRKRVFMYGGPNKPVDGLSQVRYDSLSREMLTDVQLL